MVSTELMDFDRGFYTHETSSLPRDSWLKVGNVFSANNASHMWRFYIQPLVVVFKY